MNDLHVTIGHNVRGVPTHNTATVCATAERILGIEGMTAYQCVGYWHGEHEASTRIEVCGLNDDEAARMWALLPYLARELEQKEVMAEVVPSSARFVEAGAEEARTA